MGGFLSYTKNPILWHYNTAINRWRPDNYEGQHQQGLHLTVTDVFSPKYNATLSYTYTNSKTDWGDKDPSYTSLVARHQVQAALRYKDKHWSNNILLTSGFGRNSDWYSRQLLCRRPEPELQIQQTLEQLPESAQSVQQLL